MAEPQCCAVMDLQWTNRVVDEQRADIYFCASCGTVHRTEKYSVSMRFPYHDRCVNCGGDLHLPADLEPGQTPDPARVRCIDCGLTAEEDRKLHERLASIHPEGDYLSASEALAESGRFVLALKLATAETRWGNDPIGGEIQRLGVFEAMNEVDRALDEGYEWSENEGCPAEVWGVLASLEAASGNVRGAMAALEKGLHAHPDNTGWWADYAELNLDQDERPGALRAAAKALADPATERRAIAVMTEVGERFYASGLYAEALGACSLAQDRQEHHADLAWLRARISAVNQDTDYMVRWLDITTALDPGNQAARDMLAPYKKRKGWFTWGGGA